MSGAEVVYRFRPRRWAILPVLICGLPFALFAAYAPWSAGPRHLGWWLGLAMAVSAAYCYVLAPVLLLATAVTVGPVGLTKSPRWNWGFAVEWTRVESWSVGRPPAWHEDLAHARVVRFRVARWRRVMIVVQPGSVQISRAKYSTVRRTAGAAAKISLAGRASRRCNRKLSPG